MRLFRTALRTLSEDLQRGPDVPVSEVVELVNRMGRLPPTDDDSEKPARADDLILTAVLDPDLTGSLRHDATQLHRLAWRLRDRISADAWRILSQLEQRFEEPGLGPAVRVSRTLDLLDHMLTTLSAFSGLVMESTTRGLGWRFLVLGRRLERGLRLVDLMRSGLAEELPPDSRRLEKVLEIADCSMTYRSRYRTSVQLPLVVDLLLLDEANPRSFAFQAAWIREDLEVLEKAQAEPLHALLDRLRNTTVEEVVALQPDGDGKGRRGRLEELLGYSAGVFLGLSESVNHAYLSHALPRRQPATLGGTG